MSVLPRLTANGSEIGKWTLLLTVESNSKCKIKENV